MKRITGAPWLVIALVAVLGAAFLVQATSTWKFGERQHLVDLALPALVVLLEVGSITAASIFFSARSRGLRIRALAMLAVTAGLGGTGGVLAYGFAIGVPVAVLMLGLVEIVGAARHERSTTLDQPSTTSDQPSTTLDHEPVEPAPSPRVDERVDEPRPFVATVIGEGTTTRCAVPFVDPDPTEPLPRLDDGRALDPLPEPEPDESWRQHRTTEAEYAALILGADLLGRPISERDLHTALSVVCPDATRYRAKKYLGNATRRALEAVG